MLLFLDQEKRPFAQTKTRTTISQLFDCKFCFLHFLKKSVFVIERVFVQLRDINLYLKVESRDKIKCNKVPSITKIKINSNDINL